jgi:hypothetical protein
MPGREKSGPFSASASRFAFMVPSSPAISFCGYPCRGRKGVETGLFVEQVFLVTGT